MLFVIFIIKINVLLEKTGSIIQVLCVSFIFSWDLVVIFSNYIIINHCVDVALWELLATIPLARPENIR